MDDFHYWFNLVELLIIVVIIIVGIFFAYRRFTILKQVFESQALKRNGSVTGSFMRYNLTFSYRDSPITVSEYPGSKYQSAYTRVVTSVKNPGLQHVKIYCETLASDIGKKLGKQEIQIGINEFDEKFMIQGTDEYFVINLLTSNIQDKLLALRGYRPTVTLENSELKVNVPRVLKTDEGYDLLIDAALIIIDRLIEIQ